MSIPTQHRPIFDGLTTFEEKMKVAMAEYNELKETGDDGLEFSNKTSMWVAYERYIESQRPDRLFNDPLAKHVCQPYGQRMSDAMAPGLAYAVFDPPNGANPSGLGLDRHVMYTAARTKLINDRLEDWLNGGGYTAVAGTSNNTSCQVVNMDAGMDTRVYWFEALQNARYYWEIDTASVIHHKQKVLDDLRQSNELPEPYCAPKSIAMDFSQETIGEALVTKHQYQVDVPTCWILEGLIMYLKRPDVEQLLDDMSALSAPDSMLILNFSNNVPDGPNLDEISARLLANGGWHLDTKLMFGDEGFNFNRYPTGKPANNILGFAFYTKQTKP